MSTNRIRFAPLSVTLALLTACAGIIACASAPVARTDGLQARTHATRGLVTIADLRTFATNESLFESLRRIRPELFIPRARDGTPAQTDRYAVVYLDGVFQGDLSSLETIPSRVVTEIEYLTSMTAATRYGFHPGGVIDVRTRGATTPPSR